jgi:hypothetical protein
LGDGFVEFCKRLKVNLILYGSPKEVAHIQDGHDERLEEIAIFYHPSETLCRPYGLILQQHADRT